MSNEPTWREFDTLDGVDPRVKDAAFADVKAIKALLNRVNELQSALNDCVLLLQEVDGEFKCLSNISKGKVLHYKQIIDNWQR
jgi:hypothetical protein